MFAGLGAATPRTGVPRPRNAAGATANLTCPVSGRAEGKEEKIGAPPLQLLSGTGSLHPPPRSFPILLAVSPGSSSREAAMLRLWSRLPSRNGEKTKICPRVFPPFLQNLNFLFFFLNFGISSRFWAKIQVIFVLPETWLPVPWSNSSLLAPAAIWHSQRME